MKIKSIATICKKNKQVVLFNRYSDSGTISQYIGDGSAHCGSRPYNPENPDAPCSAQSKKPEGVAVELADCVIRILDYCGHAGIDIEEAIRIKHEYNKTRPYRHGGKKC